MENRETARQWRIRRWWKWGLGVMKQYRTKRRRSTEGVGEEPAGMVDQVLPTIYTTNTEGHER
jgi:hypothetical protein